MQTRFDSFHICCKKQSPLLSISVTKGKNIASGFFLEFICSTKTLILTGMITFHKQEKSLANKQNRSADCFDSGSDLSHAPSL